jgi:inosine/xanthosine triphosphate pyrophosphatase family protein
MRMGYSARRSYLERFYGNHPCDANPSKALQIQEIFGDSGIRILTMDEAGITGEAYEPEKGTFESNAFLKAQYVREQKPCLGHG